MKHTRILLLALAAVLFSFGAASLFYTHYMVRGIHELDMKLKVGDVAGFDVNSSVISFGIIPKTGGSSQRTVFLRNMDNKPVNVHAGTSGEIGEWVHISEDDFVLEANEKKEIKFTAFPPKDAERGAYTGKARFVFTREI